MVGEEEEYYEKGEEGKEIKRRYWEYGWQPIYYYPFQKSVGIRIEPKVCIVEDITRPAETQKAGKSVLLYRVKCSKSANDHDKLVELQQLYRYHTLAIRHLQKEILMNEQIHKDLLAINISSHIEMEIRDHKISLIEEETQKRLIEQTITEITQRLFTQPQERKD